MKLWDWPESSSGALYNWGLFWEYSSELSKTCTGVLCLSWNGQPVKLFHVGGYGGEGGDDDLPKPVEEIGSLDEDPEPQEE